MSIYKRADTANYWLDFTGPDGKRVKCSAQTSDRQKAQELHDRLKAQAWRCRKLGEKPDRLFDELCVKYLKSIQGSKYYSAQATRVEFWLSKFHGQTLRSLTAGEIKAALPTHRVYDDGRATVALSGATQNRYLATISVMLSLAQELEWIDSSPKIKRFAESKVNVRWITVEQAQALVSNISQDWMRDIVRFALATGCRAGEILALDWNDVDLDKKRAWIIASNAKSGHGRAVPLNQDAMAVLSAKANRQGRVFTRNGHVLAQVDAPMFNRALAKSGIEKFRFHDLRHTWASWHAQKGTPLMVLKELGGWRDLAMVMKYAHMAESHLTGYADNVNLPRGTFQEQHRKVVPLHAA